MTATAGSALQLVSMTSVCYCEIVAPVSFSVAGANWPVTMNELVQRFGSFMQSRLRDNKARRDENGRS
jgi:HPt (histidine-containing phosphotransfer) domain-containing protein